MEHAAPFLGRQEATPLPEFQGLGIDGVDHLRARRSIRLPARYDIKHASIIPDQCPYLPNSNRLPVGQEGCQEPELAVAPCQSIREAWTARVAIGEKP